ncbi:MAG: hypothetical protein ACYTGC_09875 [Planctomycetota bacterium]|jgi:hypothetical protein
MSDASPDPGADPPSDLTPAPEVVQHVDQDQLRHFVTAIKTAEQQIGEQIVRALQHDDTVAVLTTVVMGPQGQHVVSAALDPPLMQQVQKLLQTAEQRRKHDVPCVGFHCFLEASDDPDGSASRQ